MANTEIEETEEIDLISPEQDEAVAADANAKAQAEAGESPADAASSTATDGSKPDGADTLSVVRDVLDKRGADPAAASSAKAEEAGQKTGVQSTKDGDDDYSDVPFNKHPRFQKLLKERSELKVDAVRYRNVQGFLDAQGLSGEDAANGLVLLARSRSEGLTGDEMADGLSIMSLAKTNPVEAWKRMKPWVQKVIVAAGEWLPEDLQARVSAGEITSDVALELNRSRAVTQSYETQRSFAKQQAEAAHAREAADALRDAANEWANERQTRDPAFEAKVPAIMQEVQKLQSLGWLPTDPAGVKEQLRRAYAAVNGAVRTPAPIPAPAAAPQARPAIKPITGGQVAGSAGTAPQSTADHVAAVLNRRRAG